MAKVNFTADRVTGFQCEPGKQQSIFWDAKTPGLGLRVTAAGAKSYIFETRLYSKTIRITIGDVRTWTVIKAQTEATKHKALADQGIDSRSERASMRAKAEAKELSARFQVLTVGDAWAVYLEARKSKWSERHYSDHIDKAKAGGVPSKRGTRGRGVTIAGPLHTLMGMKLSDLDAEIVEAWAAKEAETRSTAARLAWRLLKVFLAWCAEQKDYASILPVMNPAKTKKSREAFGKARTKTDVLQRTQLAAWFDAVIKLNNPVVAACLQMILLTGARPGEVIEIRWEDVNTKWKGLTIRDKVEGTREIPLTPYMASLIAALPRRNEWVFSSMKSTHLTSPNYQLTGVCKVAGIDGLTLHGLRRSFKSLTEWLDIPAGVVAQIMGHKPSATAEKHYTIRPLDLLRVHHEKIEAWILEQAGIDVMKAPDGLHLVTAA